MSGTLYVVATPIGNLEDITLRALRVLGDAGVIAAEDTRRTAKLLARHAIQTRTISFHTHNARMRLPQLMARLRSGESVALVTDAGSPGVSDPGVELVQACIHAEIAVDPVPGASAPLTALIGSGFELVPFTFYGFAPNRSKALNNWLAELNETRHTFAFFEAPHRISSTLAAMATSMGERPIVVCRELTKLHQEFIRGSARSVGLCPPVARGEFTIVVGPAVPDQSVSAEFPSDADVVAEFLRRTREGVASRKEAVQAAALKFGVTTKNAYAAIERLKKCGE